MYLYSTYLLTCLRRPEQGLNVAIVAVQQFTIFIDHGSKINGRLSFHKQLQLTPKEQRYDIRDVHIASFCRDLFDGDIQPMNNVSPMAQRGPRRGAYPLHEVANTRTRGPLPYAIEMESD